MTRLIQVPVGKPGQFALPDAMLAARMAHISRFVQTDFGWAPISKVTLIALLERVRDGVKVEIMKEEKFAIYYFSLA